MSAGRGSRRGRDVPRFDRGRVPAADPQRVQLIEDDEIVAITPDGANYRSADGEEVFPHVEKVDWDNEAAEKGGFETFMLKEIYEQPDAIEETIGDRIRHGRLELDGLGLDDKQSATCGGSSSSPAERRITPASSRAT